MGAASMICDLVVGLQHFRCMVYWRDLKRKEGLGENKGVICFEFGRG